MPDDEHLIEHVREQIERDPQAYANEAKLRVVTDKLIELLQQARREPESESEHR